MLMPQFTATIAEVLQLGTGLAGLYLTVALVVTLAQAHLGVVTGQPRALADVLERVIPVVLCFAVAVTAPGLGRDVSELVSGVAPSNAATALALWHALASLVVKTIILSIGASLAVGIATGAFSAQLAVFVGQPNGLSSAWACIGLVVLTAVLTITSVTLADVILQLAG